MTHNVILGDGQGRVNREIALRALARGVSVTLVADFVDEDILAAGARWRRVRPILARPHLAKVLSFVRRANGLLADERADAVLANGFVATTHHAINISHFVHHAWLRTGSASLRESGRAHASYQQLYARVNTLGEQRSYAAAERVVAVSDVVHEQLLASGVPRAKLSTVYNGVDLEEFRPGRSGRAALGLPQAVPLAMFVGAIRNGRKNLDTVLHALRLVPELHLVVVGDATASPFPVMAARLGVDRRVHFLGFRRDTPELYRAVDFVVAPSRYEPFSLVVLEAMASGKPVLTARTVGASVLAERAGLPVISSPEDAGALASLMRVWCNDPAAVAELGATSRAVALENSWSAMADRYLQMVLPELE